MDGACLSRCDAGLGGDGCVDGGCGDVSIDGGGGDARGGDAPGVWTGAVEDSGPSSSCLSKSTRVLSTPSRS